MRYTLARVLGNELPPRDQPGSRAKVLRFILENEPNLPGCRRVWVLNQIHQRRLRAELVALLELHGQEHHELRFDRREYAAQRTREDKIRCAININKARNLAISLGGEADFTFVFDGDCFFTSDLWAETTREIEEDQALHPERQYYGVPGVRVIDALPHDYRSLKRWEPSLVLRRDAGMRFDESLPFSKCDKVEFLRRLGYQREQGETVLLGDLCKNVGCLVHISFGNEEVETDLKTRMRLRDESIDKLLGDIEQLLL